MYAKLFHLAADKVRFYCVWRAGLKVYFDHAVYFVFAYEPLEQLHAHGVRHHYRAAYAKITLGDGRHNVVRFGIDKLIRGLYARAVFKAYNRAAVFLNGFYGFVHNAAYGAAGYEYALVAIAYRARAGSVCGGNIVIKVCKHRHAVGRIEYEARPVKRGVKIKPLCHGRNILLHFHQPYAGAALFVALNGGPAERIVRYCSAELSFKELFEAAQLRRPFVKRVLPLALGKMQYICWANLVEQLIHFLFAVARCFAHYYIRKIGIRAFVRYGEAVA